MSKSSSREAISLAVVHALRAERQRQGLSMERLAEKAGLSQGTISLIEGDLRNPTLDTLLRIAEVLELNLGLVIQQAIDETSGGKPT